MSHKEDGEEFLEHYGVKGMKWGVRNDRSGSGGRKSSKQEAKVAKAQAEIAAYQQSRANELAGKYGPGSLDGKTEPQTSRLSDDQKAALKSYAKKAAIGAAVVGAGYVIYKANQGGAVPGNAPNWNPRYNPRAIDLLNADVPEGFHEFIMESDMHKMRPKQLSDLKGQAVNLPIGSIVKRVSTEPESYIKDGGFYASFKDDDVTRYKAALPLYWAQWGVLRNPPSGHVVNIKAKTAIKAPSELEAFELWKQYRGRDGTADEYARDAAGWLNPNHGFLKFVKDKGFNALIDTNDAGSLSELPMRFLNSDDFEISGHDALDLAGIRDARRALQKIQHFMMEGGALGALLEEGEQFLEHYGVKGMRWGVRRSDNALARAAAQRKANRDPSTPEGAARAARKAAAKNRRTISDGDLDKFVQRLEKEKKLKSLVEEDLSAGQKATKAFLSDTGQRIAKQAVVGTVGILVGAALANKFGDTSSEGAKKVIPTAKDIFDVAKPQKKK